ncbi:MAG: glycoside hydrolase family 3 C-terminal domain-containing protein, partial [Thermoanaerobaculia bacterium]
IEQAVAELLGRMSVEEKVGQVIQAEIRYVTPADVQQYHLGSVLNGGGAFPGENKYAEIEDWLALADGFWEASMDTAATSIWDGIREAVEGGGGSATLSVDGSFDSRPDVAIVVFGEDPYAEFQGDRETLEYQAGSKRDLRLLRKLQAEGIPVVLVFLSGRPMWVNSELNASDAFVAAWLPGTEGGGVADVLFRAADGSVAHDFQGRLSFSWPKLVSQNTINRTDVEYDPLFAYGFGLRYDDDGELAELSEKSTSSESNAYSTQRSIFWRRGRPRQRGLPSAACQFACFRIG